MADDEPVRGLPPILQALGRSFEEGDTEKYSRSDILRSLLPVVGAPGLALPALVYAKAPTWLLEVDAIAFVALLAGYFGLFVYCFWKRPESLRSEKYELTKYAIEQQLFGDNTRGLIEATPTSAISAVATKVNVTSEGK